MLELRIGDVLARSLDVLFKNFVPFMLLTAVVHLPFIVLGLLFGSGAAGTDPATVGLLGAAGGLGGYVLDTIASAAVIYGVFQQLRGQHASMGACISIGLGRLLPVIGVGILSFLCICLGLVALVIPGIIVALMLYVAVPVTVVEKLGAVESLKRSKELTQGHRGILFGLLLVVTLCAGAFGAFVGFFVAILPDIVETIVRQGISILTSAWGAAMTGVVYHDLRVIKDGVQVDDLVSIFE